MKFDAKCIFLGDLLVWYFYKGLRPLIKLWIDKEGRELDGWKKLIKKATRAKAKAKMQLASSHNIDQCCYRFSVVKIIKIVGLVRAHN